MRTATIPNLHINITDDMRGGMGGIPIARTPSNSSVNSTSSIPPPLTPVNQTISTPTTNRQFMFHRLNSVSSIATSEGDSDISSRLDNPLDSFLDWVAQDDDLLMTVYQSFVDNPTTAPFAGNIPPSGVVHQVARATLHEAKKQSRPFLHSFIAVRKRLLLLCERHAAPIYSRASSTTSLSSTSSFNFNNTAVTPGTINQTRYFRQLSFGSNHGSPDPALMTPLANRIKRPYNSSSPGDSHGINNNGSSFMLGHPDDYDEEMAFVDDSPLATSLLPPPPAFKIPEFENNNNRHNSLDNGRSSPFDRPRQGSHGSPTQRSPSLPSQTQSYCNQTQQNIANWLLSTPNNQNNTSSNLEMPLTPAPSPLNVKTNHYSSRTAINNQSNLDDFDFGLDSPFKEITVTPTRQSNYQQSPTTQSFTPNEDPYPNYTAQRKRESLRMKRGMKATPN